MSKIVLIIGLMLSFCKLAANDVVINFEFMPAAPNEVLGKMVNELQARCPNLQSEIVLAIDVITESQDKQQVDQPGDVDTTYSYLIHVTVATGGGNMTKKEINIAIINAAITNPNIENPSLKSFSTNFACK